MQVFNSKTIIGNFAYGDPSLKGRLKVSPSDFIVIEHLPFELTGEGEHVYCYIEKEDCNSEFVASSLAKALNIRLKMISYAGLKDRKAKTYQWFSLHLPGLETPALMEMSFDHFKILQIKRHRKKLAKGALKGNQFHIRLRDVEGDIEAFKTKIEKLKEGMPNYFTEQRFGNHFSNLHTAKDMLFHGKKIKNKLIKSLAFSAVRSYLFNRQLATRISHHCFNTAVPGDLMMLYGSQSVFHIESVDTEIEQRVMDKDIVPSGILMGSGDIFPSGQAIAYLEQSITGEEQWIAALKEKGLKQHFRPFVIYPKDLTYDIKGKDIELAFFLPKGSYATALVRELCDYFTDDEPSFQ